MRVSHQGICFSVQIYHPVNTYSQYDRFVWKSIHWLFLHLMVTSQAYYLYFVGHVKSTVHVSKILCTLSNHVHWGPKCQEKICCWIYVCLMLCVPFWCFPWRDIIHEAVYFCIMCTPLDKTTMERSHLLNISVLKLHHPSIKTHESGVRVLV